MRQVFIAMAALGCLILGGPAAAEEASSQEIAASIPIGTTKQQLEAHYGTPTSVAFSQEGNEIWTYDIKKVRVEHKEGLLSTLGLSSGTEGVDETVRIFRVWFDQNGKVTAAKALQ